METIKEDYIVTANEFNLLSKEVTKLKTFPLPITYRDNDAYVMDLSKNDIHAVTLTEDTMIETPIGLNVGRTGIIIITQDTTGGRTLNFDYTSWFSPSGEINIDINPNDEILLEYTVVSSTRILLVLKSNYNLGE